MTGSHDHGGHSHGPNRGRQRRALWIALLANGGFLGVEVVGGLAFHSLALLADAAHMFSDVVGLSIALVAQQLLSRPATAKHTFGLQRSEVLGGQLNGLTLLAVAGWVIYEAFYRLGQPVQVAGGGLLIVATLGLMVNVGSAIVLARAKGRSLNMKGAYVHMAVDAVGSVGAIIAGIGVIAFKANWLDPAVSLLISLLVIYSGWSLIRDATNVLLEGSPGDVNLPEVEAALASETGVQSVHHTHLWSLASDMTAFSGHVVMDSADSLHDAQLEGERLKGMLHDRFQIEHATLELECHVCTPDGDEPAHAHNH